MRKSKLNKFYSNTGEIVEANITSFMKKYGVKNRTGLYNKSGALGNYGDIWRINEIPVAPKNKQKMFLGGYEDRENMLNVPTEIADWYNWMYHGVNGLLPSYGSGHQRINTLEGFKEVATDEGIKEMEKLSRKYEIIFNTGKEGRGLKYNAVEYAKYSLNNYGKYTATYNGVKRDISFVFENGEINLVELEEIVGPEVKEVILSYLLDN